MVLAFKQVEIIEHPVIFNSSYDSMTGQKGLFCKDGGPLLLLSWDVERRTTVDIDIYEVTRNKRRHGRELRLSSSKRMQILERNRYHRSPSSRSKKHNHSSKRLHNQHKSITSHHSEEYGSPTSSRRHYNYKTKVHVNKPSFRASSNAVGPPPISLMVTPTARCA